VKLTRRVSTTQSFDLALPARRAHQPSITRLWRREYKPQHHLEPSSIITPLAIVHLVIFNLESAVGSQKSTQALGVPAKIKKCRITTEVTTNVFISPGTPISCTFVLRPTAVSRFNKGFKVFDILVYNFCNLIGKRLAPLRLFCQAIGSTMQGVQSPKRV